MDNTRPKKKKTTLLFMKATAFSGSRHSMQKGGREESSSSSSNSSVGLFGLGRAKQLQEDLSAKEAILKNQQLTIETLENELEKVNVQKSCYFLKRRGMITFIKPKTPQSQFAHAATRDMLGRTTNELLHLQSLLYQLPVFNAANSELKAALEDLDTRFALANERCSILEGHVRVKTAACDAATRSLNAAAMEVKTVTAKLEAREIALALKESQIQDLSKQLHDCTRLREQDRMAAKQLDLSQRDNDSIIQHLKSQQDLQIQQLNNTIIQLQNQSSSQSISSPDSQLKLAILKAEAKVKSDHYKTLNERDSLIARLQNNLRALKAELAKQTESPNKDRIIPIKEEYERRLKENQLKITTLETELSTMKASIPLFNPGVPTPKDSPTRSTHPLSFDQEALLVKMAKSKSHRAMAKSNAEDSNTLSNAGLARKISMARKPVKFDAPVRTTSMQPLFVTLEMRRIDIARAPDFKERFCSLVVSNFVIPDVTGDAIEQREILFPSHAIGTVCAYMLANDLLVELNEFSLFAINAMQTAPTRKNLPSLIFWISNIHQLICILESLRRRQQQTLKHDVRTSQLAILARIMDRMYVCLEDHLLPNLFEDLDHDMSEIAHASVLHGVEFPGSKGGYRFTMTAIFGLGGASGGATSNGLLQLNSMMSDVGRVLKNCHVPKEFRERVLLNMLRSVGLSGFNSLMELKRGFLTPTVARKVNANLDTIVGWYIAVGMNQAGSMVALLKQVVEAVLMQKKTVPEDLDLLLNCTKKVGIKDMLYLLDHCCSWDAEESLAMSPAFLVEMKHRAVDQNLGPDSKEMNEEDDPIEAEITVEPVDQWELRIPASLSLPEDLKLLLV
ncbi:hypothetical protein BJ741DRAFT_648580 [Chytriomyces cf. hyalinus JEL632]|nr:hypothetical protein BJ741DRAFT_648580 [Chytriomyces cf. hyalinus JEL632]